MSDLSCVCWGEDAMNVLVENPERFWQSRVVKLFAMQTILFVGFIYLHFVVSSVVCDTVLQSPGRIFGVGEWKITYQASDEAGWSTECTFDVIIHEESS